MKKLLFILLIGFLSCSKEEAKIECYRCVTNWTVPAKHVYDTCVLQGQRTWRDETINCYLKTN